MNYPKHVEFAQRGTASSSSKRLSVPFWPRPATPYPYEELAEIQERLGTERLDPSDQSIDPNECEEFGDTYKYSQRSTRGRDIATELKKSIYSPSQHYSKSSSVPEYNGYTFVSLSRELHHSMEKGFDFNDRIQNPNSYSYDLSYFERNRKGTFVHLKPSKSIETVKSVNVLQIVFFLPGSYTFKRSKFHQLQMVDIFSYSQWYYEQRMNQLQFENFLATLLPESCCNCYVKKWEEIFTQPMNNESHHDDRSCSLMTTIFPYRLNVVKLFKKDILNPFSPLSGNPFHVMEISQCLTAINLKAIFDYLSPIIDVLFMYESLRQYSSRCCSSTVEFNLRFVYDTLMMELYNSPNQMIDGIKLYAEHPLLYYFVQRMIFNPKVTLEDYEHIRPFIQYDALLFDPLPCRELTQQDPQVYGIEILSIFKNLIDEQLISQVGRRKVDEFLDWVRHQTGVSCPLK